MKSSLPGVSLSGKPLNACTKKKDLDTGEGGSLFGEPAVPNTEGADFPSLSEQKDHIISEQLARLDEQKKKITGTRQQLEDCDGSEDDDAKCGSEGFGGEDGCRYGEHCDTHRYCGATGFDSLIQCLTCQRYFCNTRAFNSRKHGPSHAVHHVIVSKHREVALHHKSPLGGYAIECFICGTRNILQLGMIAAEGEDVLVILCRDSCLLSPDIEGNGWRAANWQPLIEDKCIVSWIVRERALTTPLTNRDLLELEECWSSGSTVQRATAEEEVLRRGQLCYQDGADYQRTLAPLVQSEAAANFKKTTAERLDNVKVRWVTEGDNVYCFFFVESESFETNICIGGRIRISRTVPHVDWYTIVGVIDINKYTGELKAQRLDPWFERQDTTFSLRLEWNETPFKRMHEALHSFASETLSLSGFLYETILGITDDESLNPLQDVSHVSAPNLPPLNPSQIDAVGQALRRSLTLIQGPPGTGKTLTAATLVYQLVKQAGSREKVDLAACQVLVCAPSNTAVDNLAVRIRATGLKVVRVYSYNYESLPELCGAGDISLHHLITRTSIGESEEFRKLLRLREAGSLDKDRELLLRTLRRKAEFEVLSSADVVCCTCIGAGDRRLQDFRFHRVVVDESTQATEPEGLVPLVKGAKKVILIGDQCQLGPVLLSSAARDAGLDVSLFWRLLLRGHPCIRLNIQYRMHPALAAFPSFYFYEGSLQNGVTKKDRELPGASRLPFQWPKAGFPSFFYCSSGKEELSASGTSYVNRDEATKIQRLLSAFIRSGLKADQIGVITPYAGQRKYLRELLQRQPNLDTVEIDSIDSFQGQERDVIIISCVRSNSKGEIGFLADTRRLNVAITRARFCLVICGNAKVLAQHIKTHIANKKESTAQIDEVVGPSPVTVLRDQQEAQDPFIWKTLIRYYAERNAVVCGTLSKLRSMELDKWWSVAAPGELGRGSDFADACEAGEDIRDYKRSEGRSIEVKDTPSAITRNVGPQRTEQGAASSRCDDGTGSKRCDTLGQLAVDDDALGFLGSRFDS